MLLPFDADAPAHRRGLDAHGPQTAMRPGPRAHTRRARRWGSNPPARRVPGRGGLGAIRAANSSRGTAERAGSHDAAGMHAALPQSHGSSAQAVCRVAINSYITLYYILQYCCTSHFRVVYT